MPDYICYDKKLCDLNLFLVPHSLSIDLLGNNSTCRPSHEFVFYDDKTPNRQWSDIMKDFYKLTSSFRWNERLFVWR